MNASFDAIRKYSTVFLYAIVFGLLVGNSMPATYAGFSSNKHCSYKAALLDSAIIQAAIDKSDLQNSAGRIFAVQHGLSFSTIDWAGFNVATSEALLVTMFQYNVFYALVTINAP